MNKNQYSYFLRWIFVRASIYLFVALCATPWISILFCTIAGFTLIKGYIAMWPVVWHVENTVIFWAGGKEYYSFFPNQTYCLPIWQSRKMVIIWEAPQSTYMQQVYDIVDGDKSGTSMFFEVNVRFSVPLIRIICEHIIEALRMESISISTHDRYAICTEVAMSPLNQALAETLNDYDANKIGFGIHKNRIFRYSGITCDYTATIYSYVAEDQKVAPYEPLDT